MTVCLNVLDGEKGTPTEAKNFVTPDFNREAIKKGRLQAASIYEKKQKVIKLLCGSQCRCKATGLLRQALQPMTVFPNLAIRDPRW